MTPHAVFNGPRQRLEHWNCHAGDVTVALTAESDWLKIQREHLSGFLTAPPRELELAAFNLRAHTDDRTCQAIARRVADARRASLVEPVPGLVMRQADLDNGRRGYTIVMDEVEHRVGAYTVAVAGRQIELFTHSRTDRAHRYPLRLIREAMLRTYEDTGGIVFHAAGVAINDAAIMISGPRWAGKTTTTAALLRAPGAALLSNDRLILHNSNRVVAVPLPVPTAWGTIEAYDELRHAASRTARAAGTGRADARFRSTTKHPFTARGFASAFGAPLASTATARQVLLPNLSDSRQPTRVRRLSRTEAQTRLAASCFTPRDEFWIQPWLVPRTTPAPQLVQQANAAVEHLAATLPCVEVSFGVRNPITELVRAVNDVVGDLA